MTSHGRLAGVIPPLCTPLAPDGEVDESSLDRLVDHLVDGGVHGLFVLGTTGEVSALSDAQRERVVAVAVARAAGRLPVLVGAIDTGTARVVDQARRAAAAGASAVVVTAPFYAGTHPTEIHRHFTDVAARVDVPVVAYDIPSRVGTKLRPETVIDLAADGAIVAVKDSSGSDVSLRALLSRRSRRGVDLSVFTGSELTVDYAIGLGCDGVVPGLGNVDPAGYRRLFDLARAGRTEDARAEQDRLFELFRITAAASTAGRSGTSAALGAFKAALVTLGVITGANLARPGIPLDEGEIEAVRGIVAEFGPRIGEKVGVGSTG
ncbi:dihydrodipicolinate synthase family protein [Occultella glacieicola]|uniref:Dihydrodipicolinate synthase family protein n=1 Tax=Occultella glacieicola TaxID=2518684 RepID=A0ABY2E4F1_9MICO|nr:dihydrodipicolinate synthase family protein [Occultella glacieicola]TDE94908.1 dihydrodipicolinate synthase family protein [Occultella glacieicola]